MENVVDMLLPYYVSTEYEPLFIGNFVDRVHSFDMSKWEETFWNPLKLRKQDEKYRIYCTLCWTIHNIQALLNVPNTDTSMMYYLVMCMDMHIPLMIYIEDDVSRATDEHLLTDYGDGAPILSLEPNMKSVFHEGNLPDVLHYIPQCSFFSDTRSKSNPLVHLLSKSLPQRCQIRNLREIVSSYCLKYPDVYTFVFGCLKCSLLGMYQTCQTRPPLEARVKLIRHFNTVTKAEMLQWMMRHHQQLLFYTIKEFLIYGVQQIPSLYEEIQERYYWDKFESCVTKAMNTVRKYVSTDTNVMDFVGIEAQLITINKQQVHHLYRPKRHQFCYVVVTECNKIDDANGVDYISREVPEEYKQLMHDMAIRTPLTPNIPYEWLQYFNVSKETIKSLSRIQDVYMYDGSKTALKGMLGKLSRMEFETVRDFSDAFDRKFNARVFTLPVHIYTQQYVALRLKYGIPDGQELPPDIGDAMLCHQCKQFKAFVVSNDERSKSNNLYAYGAPKVLMDDETMIKYCGKRCEKVDGKKRHHQVPAYSSYMSVNEDLLRQQTEDRDVKRSAKEKRKSLKSNMCANTQLSKVNLLGTLLQYYNHMYMICPVCANFMEMTAEYYTEHGPYCGCCVQHGRLYTSVSCEWCKAVRGNETWTPVLVTDDTGDESRDRSIYLCQTCYKPWIRNATRQLSLTTIERGLAQRWKKLQHAENT